MKLDDVYIYTLLLSGFVKVTHATYVRDAVGEEIRYI